MIIAAIVRPWLFILPMGSVSKTSVVTCLPLWTAPMVVSMRPASLRQTLMRTGFWMTMITAYPRQTLSKKMKMKTVLVMFVITAHPSPTRIKLTAMKMAMVSHVIIVSMTQTLSKKMVTKTVLAMCAINAPDDGNDIDEDGICDSDDNCPSVPNAYQIDSNHNGVGDRCELYLTVGTNAACVKDMEGAVVCWGTSNIVSQVSQAATDYIQIDTGMYHGCGVRQNQEIQCWGSGTTDTGVGDSWPSHSP